VTKRRWLLAAFWAACISVGILALLPQSVRTPTTGWDKSNHALAFAALAYLGALCWPARVLALLAALAAYGGAIEIAQTFTETRFGEWIDWFADIVGLLGAAAWIAWDKRRRTAWPCRVIRVVRRRRTGAAMSSAPHPPK
jgi:VanZ family protein